jgi:hypothetical protein
MHPPIELYQVIRREADGTSSASRFDHPLLLTPVIGAFLQMLWTRSVPWLIWPLLVLAAALATRILKARPVPRLRSAVLGADGVRIADGFFAPASVATVERRGEVVLLTTTAGGQIELRALPSDVARLQRVLDSLEEAMSATALDPAGERTLTELGGQARRTTVGPAYRALALDRERCLAVVEDAAAAPAARIAAAEVLADETDREPALRERLASAADATANETLREVLLRRSTG